MSPFKFKVLATSIFAFIYVFGTAQISNFSTLTKDKELEIDKLCEQWDKKTSPGTAVLIMNNGELVYQKGFGMANVEQQIPIDAKTKFPLAELSAHFTAFAVLMLEERGTISLDESITKYIPDLSELTQRITIGDLLQHSSGLDDLDRLKTFAGWTATDNFGQKDALNIISSQRKLIFEPGTRVSFSHSNLVLLAEVITAASGKPFNMFMKEEIFIPLNMNNTLVAHDKLQIIDNAAVSYHFENEQLKHKDIAISLLGANNVYSTLEDLVKWEKHLSKPKLVKNQVVDRMNRVIEFTKNGKTIKSERGITLGQIGYHAERGAFKSWMMGTTGGFSSSTTKLVDKGYSAYVFSNSGERYTGYIGVRAAGNLNPNYFPNPPQVDYSKVKTIDLSNKDLKKYCGNYWNSHQGLDRKITLENDTLRYVRTGGYTSALLPVGKDKFQMVINGEDELFMHFDLAGKKQYSSIWGGDTEGLVFEEYKVQKNISADLEEYAGNFMNPNLGVVYNLVIDDGKLIMKNSRSGETHLAPIKDDTFNGNTMYFSNVSFKRNTNSKVIGLNIKQDGENYIYLSKVNIQ